MNNGENPSLSQGPICPIPLQHKSQIIMGHGSGGRMSHDLIKKTIFPYFNNPILNRCDDAGVIILNNASRLAISTDSHVVYPLFFPGGDIGRLAVCGTVNDVSMMGARPLYITAGFILEEGLEIETLEKVLASMKEAAEEAEVQIIAGDTKVVQRGKADGLYINTTGVGVINHDLSIGGMHAKPGDVVILSGTIGDHGMAVLSARGELGFEIDIESDIAPLNGLVKSMLEISTEIHVLRDPTRGGLATSLNEIALQSGVCVYLYENLIPIHPEVTAACELLGFDPLYVANEGKLIAIVSNKDADKVLSAIRSHRYGKEATIIGEIREQPQGRVVMKTAIGSTRIVEMLSGELLPRIC
jgi:hydrogenase expression/formation protein HypE